MQGNPSFEGSIQQRLKCLSSSAEDWSHLLGKELQKAERVSSAEGWDYWRR